MRNSFSIEEKLLIFCIYAAILITSKTSDFTIAMIIAMNNIWEIVF